MPKCAKGNSFQNAGPYENSNGLPNYLEGLTDLPGWPIIRRCAVETMIGIGVPLAGIGVLWLCFAIGVELFTRTGHESMRNPGHGGGPEQSPEGVAAGAGSPRCHRVISTGPRTTVPGGMGCSRRCGVRELGDGPMCLAPALGGRQVGA